MLKRLILCSFILALAVSFLFSDEIQLGEGEVLLEPSSKPMVLRTLNGDPSNPFGRFLDTLYYDDGTIYWIYQGTSNALWWLVRFTPAQPCTVKAGLIMVYIISGGAPVCTLFVWDDVGGSPNSSTGADGPVAIAASGYPNWDRADFTGGYYDTDDFWVGYWLPWWSPGDSARAGCDASPDYGSRQCIGVRSGGGWSWSVNPGLNGDLMVRAIVEYPAAGDPDIDVTPDTLKFYYEMVKEKVLYPGRGIDTLIIDDGSPTGQGANGDPTWKEAVRLSTTEPCTLVSVLYYPGDAGGFNATLYWGVWDDDGSGGLPGTQVASGSDPNPTYDNWYQIDMPSPVYFPDGDIYPGWEDLGAPAEYIYNYYDSALNGYNYWYDGSSWVLDDFFSGDFMIRGIVHTEEGAVIDTVETMMINNVGTDTLYVDSIIQADPWIVSVLPQQLTIPPASGEMVTVTVTLNGLGNGTYYSNLAIYSNDPDENPYMEPVMFTISGVGVAEESPSKRAAYRITSFPNPMRTTTTISYSVPIKTDVEINIYDVAGRLVRQIEQALVDAGSHTAVWDKKDAKGSEVPQGVYVYEFITPSYNETGKIIVIR